MPLTHCSKFSMFTLRIWYSVFNFVYSFSVSMVRRRISEAQRWQIIDMCSCWQTSIGQPVLFEYGTGCEWHPPTQTLQCPVVTIRCYPWSAGSWQVFHIVGLWRRVIKRPLLADIHRRTHLAWCLARRSWNLKTWRKIHWSDESRFHVCNRRSDEGLETQKYSLYQKEHPANCPLRSNVFVDVCLPTVDV
jgi:hypothetical protein